jgi:UDP-3-O-[3-hydroxymyristoyl] glucosamine N-acyltransferase
VTTGLRLDELARLVGGRVDGDGSLRITGVNGLTEAGAGEISFLANPKYAPLLAATKAAAVVVADNVPCPVAALRVGNPDLAFARIAERFVETPGRPSPGVHPSAVVAPGARIGKDVAIGALSVVEDGASIGDGTVIYPQVYVGAAATIGPGCLLWPQAVVRERCRLGARVILHSGAVVGSDGFGFATEKGVHHKIPQVGVVEIEDDVEIGANTTIDRARFGRTVVGRGSKLDNLVQVAHNVSIGPGCLVAAQAGISGSTKLGAYVILGGQAGLAGHLEVGDRGVVTAQSGLGKDVPPGVLVGGEHAKELRRHMKELGALGRLPEALEEIRRLRKDVEALKNPKA